MSILATQIVHIPAIGFWSIFFIAAMLISFTVGLIYTGKKRSIPLFFLSAFFAFMTVISINIFDAERQTQYIATITNDTPFIEISEKYEIIDKIGNLYTLVEKAG